jgi:peptide/nickel transport system substrate-binding protein
MDKRLVFVWSCLLTASIILALVGCVAPAAEEDEKPTEVAAEVTALPTEVEEIAPTQPVPSEPIILRVGEVRALDCWNPFVCANFYYWYGLVMGNLMHAGPDDPSCAPVPYLANSWEVSDDGVTWTIDLFSDVTYSDGMPFNANVAKDVLDWWIGTDLVSYVPFTANIAAVEALDEGKLQITTKVPVLSFPGFDAQWIPMLPLHIWSEIDPGEVYTFENYPPIGTGPYTVTDYQQGEYIILDARNDFHLGKPPIDRIVIQYYSNWDAVIQALVEGEINVTGLTVPAQYYDTLSSAENVSVIEAPGTGFFSLAINSWAGEGGSRHPALQDRSVRYALDHAIDKEQLVEVLLLGHGDTCALAGVCDPPMSGEVNPEVDIATFDPDKANQILQDAGYVDSDNDGVRETPEGEALQFRLFFDAYHPELPAAAEMIEGWLAEIGIVAEAEALETGVLAQALKETHDFDLGIFYADFDVGALNMDYQYACWSAEYGVGNRAGYCNPEFDDLIFKYYTTVDPSESLNYLFQAQAVARADRPHIPLMVKNGIQAFNNAGFSFDEHFCPAGTASPGVWGFPQILNAKVR